MYFVFDKVVAKNTTESNPDTIELLPLAWGIIHEIKVFFPPGCRYSTNVQLLDGLHQVFPTNTGGSASGDGEAVGGLDWYNMEKANHQLFIKAWNTSALYDHQIKIRIGVLPREILLPLESELGLLSTFMQMFARRTV